MFVLSFASWLGSLLADKCPYRHCKLLCVNVSLIFSPGMPLVHCNLLLARPPRTNWPPRLAFIAFLLPLMFVTLSRHCAVLRCTFQLASIAPNIFFSIGSVWDNLFVVHLGTKIQLRYGRVPFVFFSYSGTAEYLANCATTTFFFHYLAQQLSVLLALGNLLFPTCHVVFWHFHFKILSKVQLIQLP
jgi:hypothetical protein